MVQLKILRFLLIIGIAVQFCYGYVPKLTITVYYESKCPDSKKFILEQLQPTVQLLHNYLKIRLIPFGKSMSLDYGDGGFVCQHGPKECLGNIVQDCSLKYMRSHSDIQRVNYVTCEMASEAGADGNLQCVQRAGLPLDKVEQCVVTGEGIALQLESEYQTSLIKPKFIPTTVINGVFNQQVQDSALIDMKGTICSFLKEVPPCAQYYNNQVLQYLFYNST